MKPEELFDKYLQQSLSKGEAEELKTLLLTDPKVGRAFVEHINEASLIVRVGSQMASGLGEVVPISLASPRSFKEWKWVAVAAAIVTLATLGWLLFPTDPALNAALASVTGEVVLEREGRTIAVDAGSRLQQDDLIRTSPQSKAIILFDGEATRAELLGGALARFSRSRRGKRIELSEGAMEATVAPQPAGQPLSLVTLHAEAKVFGSSFLLSSEVSSTRLEVNAGPAVEFTRKWDRDALLVRNGFTAIASPLLEFSARPFLPAPWESCDIGAVRFKGQVRYDGLKFRLRGAGQDTCCKKDQMYFAYQTLEGDGEIRGRLLEIEFTDPEARASLMIRQSLKSASPQVSLGVTASGRLELEHRSHNESRIEKGGWLAAPCWLRLIRRGDELSAYKSADGIEWIPVGSELLHPGRAYVGLAVTSFNQAALSTAVFSDVSIGPLDGAALPP